MVGECSVTRNIIDELHSSDIEREQMGGEGGVTRIIIDELLSSDMVKWKVKMMLLLVSLMNFFLRISREINGR